MKYVVPHLQFVIYVALFMLPLRSIAQDATLTVDTGHPGAKVSSRLHGIFFEEISHGGEGGLYAELIQNRGFEESNIPPGCTLDSGWLIPPRTPHFATNKVSDWKMPWEAKSLWPAWLMEATGNTKATLSLSTKVPLHAATPHALQLDVQSVGGRIVCPL